MADHNLSLEKQIELDSIWVHKASGTTYQVKDHHEGADGYEAGQSLIPRVGYVQLEDGKKRKAGSRYSRSLENFLQEFEVLS